MKNQIGEIIDSIKTKYTHPLWSIPFGILTLWTIDACISIFTTGCLPLNGWIFTSMIIKCSVISVNIYILYNLFILDRKSLFDTLKTYSGYCIVIVYVGYALPRLSWEMSGALSESQASTLWILGFISCLFPFLLYIVLWSKKTRLSWGIITESELRQRKEKKGELKVQRPLKDKIIETIHVIIQAIIIVIIIQHFIFQLYLIPTESMVPTILSNDRPLVTKFLSGPTIPLTEWKLPILVKPRRGSIVVFESPDYEQPSLFKKLFQHFVFLATLSLVDIDLDENQQVRKRFIVKRVIGEPGDKILMLDDTVYIRKKGEDGFNPCEADIKRYAHTDLYNEKKDIVRNIEYIPVTPETRNLLASWDEMKRNLKIEALEKEISLLVGSVKNRQIRSKGDDHELYFHFINCLNQVRVFGRFNTFSRLSAFNHYEIPLFTGSEEESEYHVFEKYFSKAGPEEYYDENSISLYALNGKKLNLLFQALCLKKFDRYLELVLAGTPAAEIMKDPAIIAVLEDLNDFYIYIKYYDNRNFPEFPAGENNVIPPGRYFLMGDNRYNSLDFRFSKSLLKPARIDKTDPHSFVYYSNLDPHLLDEKKILGLVVARLWPPDRWGPIE